MLPTALAALRPTSRVPATAVATNAALLAVVALTGSVRLAVAVGGCLYVAHFVPPLVALAILRRRDQTRTGATPAFRTPAPAVLLPLALAACAVMIVASGIRGVLGALAWLALGLLLRWGQRWRKRSVASISS